MKNAHLPNRAQRIKTRFLEEQRHRNYLLDQGLTPLEIADQMIHYQLALIRAQITRDQPSWTEQQVLAQMRIQLQDLSAMKRKNRGKLRIKEMPHESNVKTGDDLHG